MSTYFRTRQAKKLKEQAKRWLKAYQKYAEAYQFYRDADVYDEVGSSKGSKARGLGRLIEMGAGMWGRSADALRMALEEALEAADLQDPEEKRCKEADAQAMKELAEAWKKAAEAYDDAISKRKIADAPPPPLQLPDPAKEKEAKMAGDKALLLFKAAEALLFAEEARREAEQAKKEGDNETADLFFKIRDQMLKAGGSLEKAAEAAGLGQATKQESFEKAAENYKEAANKLEEEGLEEPKPDKPSSSQYFLLAAKRWEEMAQRGKDVSEADKLNALALSKGANSLDLHQRMKKGENEQSADAWYNSFLYWEAASENSRTVALVDALMLGAHLWERAALGYEDDDLRETAQCYAAVNELVRYYNTAHDIKC